VDSGIAQTLFHVADTHRCNLVGHEVQAAALVAEKFDIAFFGKIFFPCLLLEVVIVENGSGAEGIGFSREDRLCEVPWLPAAAAGDHRNGN
jgi:hypothetical protein